MGVISQPVAGATKDTKAADLGSPQQGETSAGTPGWNVIVTLPEATAPQARRVLRRWGTLYRTGYFHVLVTVVTDQDRLLHEPGEAVAATPGS